MSKCPLDKGELVKFLTTYHKQPDESFDGKYKHFGFNWRTFFNESTGGPEAIINTFDGVGYEERRVFAAQVIYRIIEGGDALERLFKAAFD
jgi:hypothetical protein